jgi:hypothetical protein
VELYAALKRRSSTALHAFAALAEEQQIPHRAFARFGMTES